MAKKRQDGMASLMKNLELKTGKDLKAWMAIARGTGLEKHGQIVAFLKKEHGLTHGYANQVALATLRTEDAPATGSDELIEAQYAGAKAHMRPIYDALVTAIRGFGKDVEFAPKKAYVSLRRSKQFGIIQPSTASRVDVGINLKGITALPRLESSGSFNAMVSHRVRVESLAEVTAELIDWLRKAYDLA